MTDLIKDFQWQYGYLRNLLRQVAAAKAEAAKWPHLQGPKDHVNYLAHNVAEHMHRLGLREKPAPYESVLAPGFAFNEVILNAPLGPKVPTAYEKARDEMLAMAQACVDKTEELLRTMKGEGA